MYTFILVGVGGYVAPKHLNAISQTGNRLLACFDPSDSVGIIDRYFPDAKFFSDWEGFSNFVASNSGLIDFLTICSPNDTHFKYINFGLEHGFDVVCEKPLTLTVSELTKVVKALDKVQNKVYPILQLRMHPRTKDLIHFIEHQKLDRKFVCKLTYVTVRGDWYRKSWKGNASRSGGLATNIGIHLFDLLCFVFGRPISSTIVKSDSDYMEGILEFERASVHWILSIKPEALPDETLKQGGSAYRVLTVDDFDFDLSGGFNDLHADYYREILEGRAYLARDALPGIEIAERLRNVNGAKT